MQTKICCKCGTSKDVGQFSAHKREKDGLQPVCKSCNSEYFKLHKISITARMKIYKQANKGAIAEYSKVYQQVNKSRLAEYIKSYHQANRVVLSEKAKVYAKANKTAIADKKKAHYQANKTVIAVRLNAYKQANKVIISKAGKAYYKENTVAIIEKIKIYRQANKDKIKLYRQSNPEKGRAHKANRRARKIGNGGKHTAKEVKVLFVLQKGKCICCKTSIKDGYHVDHVYALVNGGANDKHNLQLLCPTCNMSKGAKDPIDFMQSRGFLL